jgi:hypothetical protein
LLKKPVAASTIARQGDNLAVGWLGNVKGDMVVAYGSLSKTQQ